jgi:hypothetical protein
MTNENQQKKGALNFKNIVLLLIIVFVLFVAYKYISSNIQENKEKAVIQERFNITEKKEYQLSQCIKNAQDDLNTRLKIWVDFAAKTHDSAYKAQCESVNITFGGNKGDCHAITTNEFEIGSQQEKDIEKKQEDECYKKYK